MTFIFSLVDRAILEEHVRYLERGCTTCKKFSGGMENQIFTEKIRFFQVLKSQNILVKPFQKCVFSMKIWFSMSLENFLQVVQPRSRYLTCSPNTALSTRGKIKVIRDVHWKILAQKWKHQIFLSFEVSEYSGQTLRKVCFFNENLVFHVPRKFFIDCITTFKVSNMFS